MKHEIFKIHQHIAQAKCIVIIPHQHPDGDALGAATAFREYLHQLGKPAHIFCTTPILERWHFLPHALTAHSDTAIFNNPEVDTIVVLDSGDLRYAGVAEHLKNHKAVIINIDHHATNEHFGVYNLVVPTAASTTEVLYHFFKYGNISFNKNLSTSLLTGLITDTDNFSNAATSAEVMGVASELIRTGGNLNIVTASTMKNKSIASLRLWGTVLQRLKKNEERDLAYTYITLQDLAEHGLNDTEAEGIANFLNTLGDAKTALLLRETPNGGVKGSFRTTHDDIDVTLFAQKFGGGGHKKAAGFTSKGTLEEVLHKIIN